MVTLTMPKKKPNADGRSMRAVPMQLTEMQSIRDRLHVLSGMFAAICSEMEAGGIPEVKVQGRLGVETGLTYLQDMADIATGKVTGSRLRGN